MQAVTSMQTCISFTLYQITPFSIKILSWMWSISHNFLINQRQIFQIYNFFFINYESNVYTTSPRISRSTQQQNKYLQSKFQSLLIRLNIQIFIIIILNWMLQTCDQKRKSSNPAGTENTAPLTSRRCSKERSKSKQRRSKEKIKKRLLFQSPRNKQNQVGMQQKNLSLLNYLILKQKIQKMNIQQKRQKIGKKDFNIKCAIGKGGFGKVWRVEHKKTKILYAMKEMSKAVIITKKSVPSVMNQRHLLSQLKHPFLVNMIYAFQDRQNLYLIMDLMVGGDLRFHIGQHQFFKEQIVKFFVCCMILGLQYLHNNGIIHRDIKPQNLVIDNKGYLRITDLGVARLNQPENYQDTSGTPGYMAPQVINRQNHSYPVDYFAMGVISYQCMMGRRPYKGKNRKQIRQHMMSKEINIRKNDIPNGWSVQAADFINKLLRRKQENRLGSRGIQQIKKHPWLAGVNWNKFLNKSITSPFMPNLSADNYDDVSTTQQDEQTQQKLQENRLLLRRNTIQNLFEGYTFQQLKLY